MNGLLKNINEAIEVLDLFVMKNKVYMGTWPIGVIGKVLLIMKTEMEINSEISERVLRAMKDIYVVSFRNFEGTELDIAIKKIDNQLSAFYQNYEQLEPLGMDFNKGNPI